MFWLDYWIKRLSWWALASSCFLYLKIVSSRVSQKLNLYLTNKERNQSPKRGQQLQRTFSHLSLPHHRNKTGADQLQLKVLDIKKILLHLRSDLKNNQIDQIFHFIINQQLNIKERSIEDKKRRAMKILMNKYWIQMTSIQFRFIV